MVASDDSAWSLAGPERRQHPRKFLSGTAHLLAPNLAPMEVHTLDISLGGMGVVSPAALPPECRCEIRFTLTREPYGIDRLAAPVQVMYCVLSGRQYGFMVGLQFSHVPPDTMAVIERYMQGRKQGLDVGKY